MFLKHLRFTAVAFVCAFALVSTSGCSYLFGPKPDDAKPFVKKSDAENVKEVPQILRDWLKDGKGDIGLAVDTVVKAIDDFSRHVVGKNKNVYTETELREFISEYLVAADSPNAGDTEGLVHGIMKVKQIVLGGAIDLITKDELSRFKSLLLRVKPLLIAISPNIKTLLFNADTASKDEVTNASANLAQVLEMIAVEFERDVPGRPETSFKDLLASAHKFGLQNDAVASWLPLVESVKVLILAGDADSLRPKEWAPMVRTIAQAWGLSLRLKYNIASNSQWMGRDFAVTEDSIRQVLGLLDRALAAHGGEIPSSNFESLIDALAAKGMMPSVSDHYVKAETLKSLLPVIFGKLLYGRWHSDYDRQSQRFGPQQMKRTRELVDDWIAGQQLVNQAAAGRDSLSITQFGQGLASFAAVRKNFADDTTYQMGVRAQKQLLQFVSKGRPPIHDSEGRLIVVTRKELPNFSKWDLDFMNMIRIALEATLTGWTHDAQNAAGIVGMTDVETQEAYMDLRSLGQDFNFIDIRSNAAGTRTFMENAIFMSSSDGNPYMGLQEGVEWFNFVSSGSKIADKMWNDMEKPCGTAKIDVLGNQKLNTACFRREFIKNFPRYMPNLPKLVSWIRQDGTGARATAMLQALENAGRNRGANDDPIDSSEFRSMIPIAHYLESMFARHDANENAVLDNDELWGAFPLLAPFIKKMGNGKADGEKMQKTIFSYILEFGTVPSTDLVGIAKLGGWYLIHGWFKNEADRNRVLQVIGSFPGAAKASRANDITAYYKDQDDSLRALITRKEKTNALKMADLFQCLPEAAPILAGDMAVNADQLAPAGSNVGAEKFITRMKSMIDNDPRLETYCLPF